MIRDEYRTDFPMVMDSAVVSVRGEFNPETSALWNGWVSANVALHNGADFDFAFWRLLVGGQLEVTSFDHQTELGGPPIDVIAELSAALTGRICRRAELDVATGDLKLVFDDGVELQGLRLRRLYEDWEARSVGGMSYWSNMIREK
ncbi:hypothetical protein [Devosia aurantiaca]|uniref:Uncharacterized protein n=1 Tax=Devosia aurantiaca TaxID=2714858 RepID=A0A6M1SYU6_9HYPH|nr:hypothetical protein [Devosia aurantiaca]NGP17851.1 hypothetical protein [Devosia aurantiaca]